MFWAEQAEDLAKHNVPFLCLSDSNVEARVMYEAGVRYVIQSESLAAKAQILKRALHSDFGWHMC